MTVHICDRCGDITLDDEGCTCTTPHSASEVRRRHRAAVESARTTTGLIRDQARVEWGEHRATADSTPGSRPNAGPNAPTDRATPPRTAAAVISAGRTQARIPGRRLDVETSSGASDASTVAVPPPPYEHQPARDPERLRASEQTQTSTDAHHEQGRRG